MYSELKDVSKATTAIEERDFTPDTLYLSHSLYGEILKDSRYNRNPTNSSRQETILGLSVEIAHWLDAGEAAVADTGGGHRATIIDAEHGYYYAPAVERISP